MLDVFLNLDSDLASDSVKAEIVEQTSKLIIFDKIFITAYIALLIGFIISASTLPTTNILSLFVYIIFLIGVTVVSMLLTNIIDFTTIETVMSEVTDDIPIIINIIKYLPFSTFFTGLLGGIIFYSRQREVGGGGFSNEGFQ